MKILKTVANGVYVRLVMALVLALAVLLALPWLLMDWLDGPRRAAGLHDVRITVGRNHILSRWS